MNNNCIECGKFTRVDNDWCDPCFERGVKLGEIIFEKQIIIKGVKI